MSPRLFYHSCRYDTFFGWYPYVPWATCIHKCHLCDNSCNVETPLKPSKHIQLLDDVEQGNAAHILGISHHFHCYMHRGSQYSSCVYSTTVQSQLSPVLLCVLRKPNDALCRHDQKHSCNASRPILRWHISRKLNVMSYNIPAF